MTTIRTSISQLNTRNAVTAVKTARRVLSPDKVRQLFNTLSLEAARPKKDSAASQGIDVARILCSKLLKYFKAILQEKTVAPLSLINNLCAQLDFIKTQELFEEAQLDEQVVDELKEYLLLPQKDLFSLFSAELNDSELNDFIEDLEDLYSNPQKSSGWQDSPNKPLEQPINLELAQANKDKADIHAALLKLLPQMGVGEYLSQLLKIPSLEELQLRALKAKTQDDLHATTLDINREEPLKQTNTGIESIHEANNLYKNGALEAAIKLYQAALPIFYALQDENNYACVRSNLINALINCAYEAINENNAENAFRHCREALTYLQAPFKDLKEDLKNLAAIHNIYTLGFHQLELYDEALKYAQIELALRVKHSTEIQQLDPNLAAAKENIFKLLLEKAQHHLKIEDFISVVKICETIHSLLAQLPFPLSDDQDLKKFSLLAHQSGQYFYRDKKIQEAIHFFHMEIKLYEKISNKTNEDRINIAQQQKLLGLCCLELQQFREAAFFFEEELKTLHLIDNETGNDHYYSIKHARENLKKAQLQLAEKALGTENSLAPLAIKNKYCGLFHHPRKAPDTAKIPPLRVRTDFRNKSF